MVNNKIKDLLHGLYEENYERLNRFCYSYLRHKEDAEDVVAETFLRAYSYLEKEPKVKYYKGLLYTIAQNLIFNKFKSSNYKKTVSSTLLPEAYDDKSSSEIFAENKELRNLLDKWLGNLPSDQRQAISLKYLSELEYNEIAMIMNKSEANIRKLVSRGLNSLKNNAEDEKKGIFFPLLFPGIHFTDKSASWNLLNSKFDTIANLPPVDPSIYSTLSSYTGSTLVLKTLSIALIASLIAGGVVFIAAQSLNKSTKSQPIIFSSTINPTFTSITETTGVITTIPTIVFTTMPVVTILPTSTPIPTPTIPPYLKGFSAQLQRLPCFGFCSSYTITVKGDGTVEYEGFKNVKVLGKQTSKISQASVIELYNLVQSINYYGLNPIYECISPLAQIPPFICPADGPPTYITTVTSGGITKTITTTQNSLNPVPASLTQFQDKIDEITNSTQWIGNVEREIIHNPSL
jgi:RNA polymerase sigma factor (sigma-70 family)